MRFPTILDAFNSAARLNNQVIGHHTAELREQNEQEARIREYKIQANIDEFKLSHPYVGGANEAEDEINSEKYFGEFESFIKGQYAKEFKGTTYHNQLIGKSLVLARNHTLSEAGKWRYQRNETVYEGLINKIINNDELDADTKMERLLEALDWQAKRNGWNPVRIAQKKSKIVEGLFENALSIDLPNGITVAQAHNLLDKNVSAFEETILNREKGTINLDEWIPKKQELIDAAKTSAQKAIWKRNLNALDSIDNEWRRRTYDAMRSDNNNELFQCITDYRAYSKMRDAALNSSEYSAEDRPKIAGMFPLPAGLLDSEGGSGKGMSDEILRNKAKSFIQCGLEGFFDDPYNRITMYDAQEAYMEWAAEALGYTGREDAMRRDFPVVNEFLDMVERVVRNQNPEFGEYYDSIRIVKDYIESGYKDDNSIFSTKYADQKEHLLEQAGKRYLDLLFSTDISRTSGKEIAKKAQDFVDTFVAAELDILRINPETGKDNFTKIKGETDNDTFARAVHAFSQPDAVWTDSRQQRQFNGIDKEAAEKFVKQIAPSMLAKELKVSPEDILPGEYVKTEGGRDEDGVIEYRLKNDPDTAYRFVATKNGNKYEWKLESNINGHGWNPSRVPTKANQPIRQAQTQAQEKRLIEGERLGTLKNLIEKGTIPRPPGNFSSGPEGNMERENYIVNNTEKYFAYLKEYFAKNKKEIPEELQRVIRSYNER